MTVFSQSETDPSKPPATGVHRQEGAILRRVFPHSLALAILMGLLVWLQSGPLAWMVPS